MATSSTLNRALATAAGLLVGLLLAPPSPADADAAMKDAGGWPVYRGDVRLTGRATRPGAMAAAPVVAWQHRIEAGEVWARIDPRPGADAEPVLPAAQPFDPQKWGLGPRLVDLAGDGMLVPDPGRAAKLLPDVAGLQTVEFALVPDAAGIDPRQMVCYAHDGGGKREVWRSEVFDTVQNTNYVIADIDGDGLLEVAFAPHYRVIVIDGQTGRTKHLLRMHGLRNYGFFATTDVDRDGRLDFVVIADFAMHVDVVRNEGDRLRLLWRRDIEDNIQSKSRIIRPGPNPVLDIDGDGRLEIVFNFYNEHDDSQWHTVALDALTGDTVLDLERQYLHGTADVDGDGVPELFVSGSRDLLVPTSAPLSLLRVRDGRTAPLWQSPRGEWVTAPTTLPFTHSTIVARGTDDVVTASLTPDGRRAFLLRDAADNGSEGLRALVADAAAAAGATPVWTYDLPARPHLRWRAAADVDDDGVDEVLVSFQQTGIADAALGTAHGARIEVAQRRTITAAGTGGTVGPSTQSRPVVVAAAGGGRPARVIYEGANHDIVALEAPRGSGSPTVRWRVPGAGPAVIAELDGDGKPEVVYADWAADGEGEMAAVDLDGQALWRRRVVGFPGPHPPWNFGGITTWWVGSYTAAGRSDVWVSARRSTMHSDEAWVLRGTDGEALWHLREVRTNQTGANERGWGAGGSLVASADVDGDELEDVLSLYPVNYMAARGATGELIHSVSAVSGLFDGVWGAYCKPLVSDLNGDGAEELLWNGSYHHGATSLDGTVLWYHAGGAGMAGLADVNADGRMELGFTGWEHGQGLRCLDGATGEPRWEWPLPGNPTVSVYSADIDGDGRDEFLFTVGRTLYSVGERDGAPVLMWQVDLPATPGDLALADVDADGKLEILFIGSDSVLYCLAADGRPEPIDTRVEGTSQAPSPSYFLAQNYPNPFNNGTVFRFGIPAAGPVELSLFGMTGQRLATVFDGVRQAGGHTVAWNGRDGAGQALASGMYLYRLRAGDYTTTRKLLLAR